MYKHIGSKRSKLKNFAPKILLCAELGVLSVRNANIVFGGTAEELGILNFEFLLRQAAKPSGDFWIVRQGALWIAHFELIGWNLCSCLLVKKICIPVKTANSKLNNSKTQAKPRINQNSKFLTQNSDGGSHLFVFFFVFSAYGRVLCTNKRLYIRLSRTGSRKT